MKDIKLFQDVHFKLVEVADMTPRRVLPDAEASTVERTSDKDPSIDDVTSLTAQDATVVYIEGYASVFLNPDGSRLSDRDGESVSVALLDIENYKKNPILVFNHDWGDVAGKVTEIRKEAKGLYIKAEVHKFTGREQVFEAVQRGIVKTFSIGFVAKTFTYIEQDDVLEISSAELVEISLAPVPANQDALFVATGQKSLTIPTAIVKHQNNMTCDELSGICSMNKNIKGKKMNTTVKTPEEDAEAARIAAEGLAEKAKLEAEEKAKLEAEEKAKLEAEEKAKLEAKEDAKDGMSVDDLADAITRANAAADLKRSEKEAAEKAALEAEEKAKLEAEAQRVTNSLDYIKERKAAIEAMEPGDIDIDELNDFYELLSDTVELINSKVVEALA